jgi:hypothetical protein
MKLKKHLTLNIQHLTPNVGSLLRIQLATTWALGVERSMLNVSP